METYQFILAGAGAAVVILLWLALRFGRQVARAMLIGGILTLGILTALALLRQASAARQAAKAAIVAASGQAVSSVVTVFCLGGLTAALAGAMGAAGVFWIRWQLAERNRRQLKQRTRPRWYTSWRMKTNRYRLATLTYRFGGGDGQTCDPGAGGHPVRRLCNPGRALIVG